MSENNVTPAPHQVTVEVGGRPLILETGKIAKQANGAIVARYGDTVVLTTACMAPTANDRDFSAVNGGLSREYLLRGENSRRILQTRRTSFGKKRF